MEDLAGILAIEIKQEIAGRYFGFRRRIEISSNTYLAKLSTLQESKSNPALDVHCNLQKLKVLLATESIFHSFVKDVGLSAEFLQEPAHHINGKYYSKPQSQLNSFTGLHIFRRYKHRRQVFYQYQELYSSVEEYCEQQTSLIKMHNDICKDIENFQRNNDLTGILDFLRQIDEPDGPQAHAFQPPATPCTHGNLNQELKIVPPPPVDSVMALLTLIPSLKSIRQRLQKLADQSFTSGVLT